MGNNVSKDCENLNNPNIKMDRHTLKRLTKEFNKESNILKKFDNDELIRVEYKEDGKRHYFFNFSSFFDPNQGFLKCLNDLHERYEEIKSKSVEDIMPFSSLIFSPLEKIQEVLEIKPGEFLFDSLNILYCFAFGAVIGVASNCLVLSGNPLLISAGVILYGGTLGTMIYESLKGIKEINKNQILEGQDDQLFLNLFKFFGNELNEHLEKCNILEIIVEESYSLLAGIFYAFTELNKKDKKVTINYWKINNFPKAKFFHELSQRQQEIYNITLELMKKYVDSNTYNRELKKIFQKYRESYQKAKKIIEENSNYKKKKNERNKILEEIEAISKTEPNSPRIQELLIELRKNN